MRVVHGSEKKETEVFHILFACASVNKRRQKMKLHVNEQQAQSHCDIFRQGGSEMID